MERRLQKRWAVFRPVFLFAAMESRQISTALNGDSRDKLCSAHSITLNMRPNAMCDADLTSKKRKRGVSRENSLNGYHSSHKDTKSSADGSIEVGSLFR